jgi:hypothetical protein
MNAHTSGLKRQAASVDSIAPILLAPASELLSCPLPVLCLTKGGFL